MNEKNDKDILTLASKKIFPMDKSRKMTDLAESKLKGTLEINIKEIMTSRSLFVNSFNTAKNMRKFDFAPTLKTSFIHNTPNNNKLSDFVIPIECKGDDGEIPDIEPIYFEKKKYTGNNKKNSKIMSSATKQKALSVHVNRDTPVEIMQSPLISDEHDLDSGADLKKSKNFKTNNNNNNFINSFQELLASKQVIKYKFNLQN